MSPRRFCQLLVTSLRVDLRDAVWHLAVNRVIASAILPRAARLVLLRLAGMDLGPMAQVNAGCRFKTDKLKLGRNTMVNFGCTFENGEPVVLGNDVCVGPEVFFCTSSHIVGGPRRRAGELFGDGITVGDGAWIGARCLLLPGAVVGDGCVLAAGSVARGKLEPHHLYAGVPARAVRRLDSHGDARIDVGALEASVRAVVGQEIAG
jgi:maltose O-acetyltransferase